MTTKKNTKRKVGRPKGSVKRTTLGEDVNHRLTKGETAMYMNVKNGLVNWILDNGEREEVTSPLMALVLSGVALNQPFFYDRLQLDPDISRAVDIVRAKMFAKAVKNLRQFANDGINPKWMEMYLRIISSDKDLGRLTGGVKFGEVANLTVDNRKQINVVAPPVESASVKQPKASTRRKLPDIAVIDNATVNATDIEEAVEAVEVKEETP